MLRRQLRRAELLGFFQALPQCVIGMEARASEHWTRELSALDHNAFGRYSAAAKATRCWRAVRRAS